MKIKFSLSKWIECERNESLQVYGQSMWKAMQSYCRFGSFFLDLKWNIFVSGNISMGKCIQFDCYSNTSASDASINKRWHSLIGLHDDHAFSICLP